MIEITPQAIDAASNRLRGNWHSTKLAGANGGEDEGLHSWLKRMAEIAVTAGEKLESGKIRYSGIKFSLLPAYRQRTGQEYLILQNVERVR